MSRGLSPSRAANIQQYSERKFKFLITQFMEFIQTPRTDKEIFDKLSELNTEWLAHCRRTPYMKPEGKNIFMLEMKRLVEDAQARAILEKTKANDA